MVFNNYLLTILLLYIISNYLSFCRSRLQIMVTALSVIKGFGSIHVGRIAISLENIDVSFNNRCFFFLKIKYDLIFY